MQMSPRLHSLCQTSERHRDAFAKLAGAVGAERGDPTSQAKPSGLPPCIHRSEQPIGQEPCLPCQGKALVDVYGCSSPAKKWGRCTSAKSREVARAHLCDGCNERQSATPVRYFLPAGYERNLSPVRELDFASVGNGRQASVYEWAAELARERGCTTLVDVGCGSDCRNGLGFQTTIGIDLPYVEKHRTTGAFVAASFDGAAPPLKVDRRSAVVCADVVEHILDPMPLLRWLASCEASVVVVSTPDRPLVRRAKYGPPTNKHHVQDWSAAEFDELLRSVGFRIAESRHVPSKPSDRKKVCYAVAREREPAPIDAVWFFRHSIHGDEELRYSLRSAAAHAPWIRRGFILGDRPAWLADSDAVVHVPWEKVAAKFGFKTPIRNAFLMRVVATEIEDLADEWLMFSDDYVLLRDLSTADARTDRSLGPLPDKPPEKDTKNYAYHSYVWKTRETLLQRGYPVENFDVHAPIRLTKRRVLDACRDFADLQSQERLGGITNDIAILNHAMRREGFVPINMRISRERAGFWHAEPTRERLQKACAEPSVRFLNFSDTSFGPTIAAFLKERFPQPAPWERT